MSVNRDVWQVGESIESYLSKMNPAPVVSTRNPTTGDKAPLGQMWVNRSANTVYFLSNIASNSATWSQAASSVGDTTVGGTLTAGTGVVVTTGGATITDGGLTVTAGGATVTGNSTITGSLAASTTITAGTGLTVTAGNGTLTNGELVISTATKGITLPGSVRIMTGAGAPANALATAIGCIYIRTDAGAADERVYIATAVNTWTTITCAA